MARSHKIGMMLMGTLCASPSYGKTPSSPRSDPKPLNLFSLLSPGALTAEIEQRHLEARSFPELLEKITRGLVAAPYVLSPLGEGHAPDPDPRFRLDAFDCTTFVETAMAMASCDGLTDIQATLDHIRYDGAPTFENRRHLMTSQWIPGLVAAGYLEDVTESVGGSKTKWIKLKLSPKRWKRRRIARSLKLQKEDVPQGTFPLPYLTIETLLKLHRQVPPGTIVNVVRKNVRSSPDVVTHQGLVIYKPSLGKTPFVRHASPVSKRVIDETLKHMLVRYTRPGRKWPIIGMNILKITTPKSETIQPLARSKP